MAFADAACTLDGAVLLWLAPGELHQGTEKQEESGMSSATSACVFARPQDLPALDKLLQLPASAELVARHGHQFVADTARHLLAGWREQILGGAVPAQQIAPDALAQQLVEQVQQRTRPHLRSVLNLTGTVIHTNLGRAVLPESALAHIAATMRAPNNLEYDLHSGGRGDRDSIVEGLLCELTGAEAATVVNNNAATVLLCVAALAQGREVLVSRGELVEIGGAFRMPDVMAAAGATLREVGTTNRTHPHDYSRAIGAQTALIMKVHTSNYAIEGFTSTVDEANLADIAHQHGLALASDLGSGALIDMSRYGLPHEPTPQAMLQAGCDVVTFSGDKLLGGPQAGLIVGKKDVLARIRRHPLKRALRMSKLPLAALEATLRLYQHPEQLAQTLPTLRLLTRPLAAIQAVAEAVAPALAQALGASYQVCTMPVSGQIGSGSLPVERLPSAAVAISASHGKGAGRALEQLAHGLRQLPLPVIGRITDNKLILDMRTLEEPHLLLQQLDMLKAHTGAG